METCGEDARWGACVGGTGPADERCNGEDDDCNGLTDEGLGVVVCGVGRCRRELSACVDGAAAACDPDEGAEPERCNGEDDDCDGLFDEQIPDQTCGVGVCFHAVSACNGGVVPFCNPLSGARAEVCNDLDDDCDGEVDGELAGCCTPGVRRPCGTGVGECAEGSQTCDEGGVWGACVGERAPAPEACNTLDDDCDGAIDDGLGIVSCGIGRCRHDVAACFAGGPAPCEPLAGAVAEICNGIDDDCDGLLDEDYGDIGGACGVGVGACARIGARICTGDRTAACSAVAGAGVPEVCDAVDNDCDGLVDDGVCGAACAELQDPSAAALARCRADGFTCEARQNAVLGWANGGASGSDCSPAWQWRFYCFADGETNTTCGLSPDGRAVCRVGEIHGGHEACNCAAEPALAGTWCD